MEAEWLRWSLKEVNNYCFSIFLWGCNQFKLFLLKFS